MLTEMVLLRQSFIAARRKALFGITLSFILAGVSRGTSDTDLANTKYSNKFAEVLRDGLVVSYCSQTNFAGKTVGDKWIGVQVMLNDSGRDQDF
jgi:hypothetical protein